MLLNTLLAVRRRSESLIDPLQPEDLGLQGMEDASPPKWHLAHTNWFFETFLLQPHLPGHQACDPRWSVLFNSYYEAVGARHPRPQRGLISRPGIDEVMRWRSDVDEGRSRLWESAEPTQIQLAELGLHHEQQHQELLVTDIKHVFSSNPLLPTYREQPARERQAARREASPVARRVDPCRTLAPCVQAVLESAAGAAAGSAASSDC